MTDTAESVLKALDALVACRRCSCPACAGEGHGHHVCTNDIGCVEKRHQMRAFRRDASRAARRAAALIRELRKDKP